MRPFAALSNVFHLQRQRNERIVSKARESLNDASNTALIRQFWSLKTSFPEALLLLRQGDFYETYLDDAELAARVLGIRLTKRNFKKKNGFETDSTPLCGFPHTALVKGGYLKKFVRAGIRVAITGQADQFENDKKKIRDRFVERIVTPGTVFEKEVLDGSQHSYLFSLASSSDFLGFSGKEDEASLQDKVGHERVFALAQYELSTGELSVEQIGLEEDLFDVFSSLSASEILLSHRSNDLNLFCAENEHNHHNYSELIQREVICPALGECYATSIGDEYYQVRDFGPNIDRKLMQLKSSAGRILSHMKGSGLENGSGFDNGTRAEYAAMVALVNYVWKTQFSYNCFGPLSNSAAQSERSFQVFAPPHGAAKSSEMRMGIDFPTLYALEVLQTTDGKKSGSLLSTIQRTCSSGGARLLRDRLKSPLTDVKEIRRRLDSVEYLVEYYELRKLLRKQLFKCGDLQRTLQGILLGRGSHHELMTIATTLRGALEISELLEAQKNLSVTCELGEVSKKLRENIEILKPLLSTLTDALVFELEPDEPNEDLLGLDDSRVTSQRPDQSFTRRIRPNFDPDLDRYVEMCNEGFKQKKIQTEKYREITGIKALRCVEIYAKNRFLEYNLSIPGSKVEHSELEQKGLILRQQLKTAHRYSTESLSRKSTEVRNAFENAMKREEALLDEMYSSVCLFRESIAAVSRCVCIVDVSQSNAMAADETSLAKPAVSEQPVLRILDGRHPVLAQQFVSFDGFNPMIDFVPNSLKLFGGQTSTDVSQPSCCLLTGSNMAGKSTFLRQNALIVILAQAGCFVPAKSAEVGIVDQIFCRVGASDNLRAGNSTFMVEMTETATILKKSTPQSLVIIDEVGRGTSSEDGRAIAQAVLEELLEKKPRTLFATHFHELVRRVKAENMQLSQMAVEIDSTNSMIFKYKVSPGFAPHSYGIHVARLAGVPDKVIARASEILEV